MMDTFKTCKLCRITSPLSNFYKVYNGKPMSSCIPCHRKKVAENYYAKKPETKPRVFHDPTKDKACPKCSKTKKPSEFYTCLGKLSYCCKLCTAERARLTYRNKVLGCDYHARSE